MSKLYGTLRGSRGQATRCGTANSGIRSSVQSYDGSVITTMGYTENGTLLVHVGIASGSSSTMDELLFSGTIDELKSRLNSFNPKI